MTARRLLAFLAGWITDTAAASGRDDLRPACVENAFDGAGDCLRRHTEMATQAAERSSSQAGRERGERSDRPPRRHEEADRQAANLEENGPSGGGWTKIVLTILILAAVAGGIYWWMNRDDSGSSNAAEGPDVQGEGQTLNKAALWVGLVHPHKGGLARTTTQSLFHNSYAARRGRRLNRKR